MKAFALPILACALLASAAVPGTDANAAGSSPQVTATQATPVTDISTAKKKKRHSAYHRGYYGAPGYGPQVYGPGYGPPAYSMWRGADPSYGPGTAQFRQFQREGRCVIDEGYGRYTFCSNR